MDNLVEIKKFVKEESLKNLSKESCGLLLKRGSTVVPIPCDNISPNPEVHFIISPLDVMEQSKTGKLVGFYHSHVMPENLKLSKYDRLVSEKLKLDSLIYSIENDDFLYFSPSKHNPEYIGRPFIIGLYDCFTLAQDYYRYTLNIKIPDPIESVQKIYRIKEKGDACPTLLKPYYDAWDFSSSEEFKNIVQLRYNPLAFHEIEEKIKNKFWIKEHFFASGFEKVNNPKEGDILLIDLEVYGKMPAYPSHCALFTQNNGILHHPLNGPSRRTVYGKLYQDRTSIILRHKDMI